MEADEERAGGGRALMRLKKFTPWPRSCSVERSIIPLDACVSGVLYI